MRLLVLLLLSGCASQAEMTFYSEPPGGYITHQGVFSGIGSAVIYYNSSELEFHKDKNGCYRVHGVKVQWVSGAYADTGTVTLCGASNGVYSLAVKRPEVPGLDKDMAFALQVQSLAIQQQQADAATNANLIQIFNSTFNKTKCTSVPVGGMVSTRC